MICDKCQGKGWYPNPKYPSAGNWAGIPSFKCGKCKSSGYIIGNVKDVLDHMEYLKVKFKNDKETMRHIEQCIDVITKY